MLEKTNKKKWSIHRWHWARHRLSWFILNLSHEQSSPVSLGDGFNYQAVDCFSLGCEGGFIYSPVSFIHRLPGVKILYCFWMKEGSWFLLYYLCCITLINVIPKQPTLFFPLHYNAMILFVVPFTVRMSFTRLSCVKYSWHLFKHLSSMFAIIYVELAEVFLWVCGCPRPADLTEYIYACVLDTR